MFRKASLIFVLGCLSVANVQTSFCSRGLCFISPVSNSGKWAEAQQMCKDNNSTLPILNSSDHQMSLVEALSHFQIESKDVWLGASASENGPKNWRWLDGNQYNGTDVQWNGHYVKSYAFVANGVSGVLAYASPPTNSCAYICQYAVATSDVCTNGSGRTAFVKENRCVVVYVETLSWFNARNKCLANSGDLASFSQLSLLDGMVDSTGFWVGLRHSQWNWQNPMTGLSSDVTFTLWRNDQPNGAGPQCMATDSGDFPNWKDADCANGFSYICQVSDIRSTTTSSSSTTATTTPASSTSTTSSTTTTKSPFGAPGTAGTSTGSTTSSPLSSTPKMNTTLHTPNENNMNSTNAGSVNMALAIGLGVGLGVPFIILIVAVIIYVAVIRPRKHRNSGEIRNAQSTQKFVPNNGQKDTDNGTTDTIDKKKKGKTPPDNSSTQYATIREAHPGGNLVAPSNEGTVYADLRFDQGES